VFFNLIKALRSAGEYKYLFLFDERPI
jgi:hypothetical protein